MRLEKCCSTFTIYCVWAEAMCTKLFYKANLSLWHNSSFFFFVFSTWWLDEKVLWHWDLYDLCHGLCGGWACLYSSISIFTAFILIPRDNFVSDVCIVLTTIASNWMVSLNFSHNCGFCCKGEGWSRDVKINGADGGQENRQRRSKKMSFDVKHSPNTLFTAGKCSEALE